MIKSVEAAILRATRAVGLTGAFRAAMDLRATGTLWMTGTLRVSIAVLCLGMAACAPGGDDFPTPAPATMRIDLSVERGVAATQTSATRGPALGTRGEIPAEDGEETVNSLYLFVFDHEPDESGAHVATIDGSTLGGSFIMEQSYTIPLETYGLSADADYSILALANVDPAASTGDMNTGGLAAQIEGMTERQAVMRANLYTVGSGTDESDDSHAPAMNNLPMSARGVWMAEEGSVQLKLRRALVRFDIRSDVSDEYTLLSASVWGAAASIPIWNTGQRAAPDRMERYYGVAATTDAQTGKAEIVGGLYAFENFVEAPEPLDTQTTCLVLGLRPVGGSGTIYYRVNVCWSGESQLLERNNVYRLRLTAVQGVGSTIQRDAWLNPGSSVIVAPDNGSLNLDDDNWDGATQ